MNRLVLQFTAQLHLKNYSPSSIQNHRLDLLRFKSWLEEQDLATLPKIQTLDGERIVTYQAHLAKRLKPRSINRHLSSLRLFFRFLEESGLIRINPMDHVVFPKTVPHLPMMLLPSEVAALLEAPDEGHYLGLRDKAMLEVLYSTGVKLNELIALDVASLELGMGFLRVDGKRQRMVPLTDKAVGLLRRYLEECRPNRVLRAEEPCLFPGRNGTRISRVGVWKLVKKYAQKAGIQRNFNPRTLRHAFAIHLILGGMDLDAIKFLFGYKRLEATALYAHVNTPDFKAAYQAYHPMAASKE
ncbi:MAG TPA: tyrosine-type recombinase/integrase [bacterium]|nr:tyrosine-type recombinase/integrase [bacterium]